MNREEALQILRDMFDYYWIEIEEKRRDEEITEIMEVLEQPATLADFLGWEEEIVYRRGGSYFKIEGNHLLHKGHSGKWVNMNLQTWELIDLRQATKVEAKLKAYHVKDRYSYDCLMKELEKQEYVWFSTGIPKGFDVFEVYRDDTVIFTENNKKMLYGDLEYYNRHENIYELIAYHKEEPRVYAKIKGWEVLGNDICYFYEASDKKIYLTTAEYAKHLTKTKWNKLGINDTNVDFEEGKE